MSEPASASLAPRERDPRTTNRMDAATLREHRVLERWAQIAMDAANVEMTEPCRESRSVPGLSHAA
jgi:hypothetical protein